MHTPPRSVTKYDCIPADYLQTPLHYAYGYGFESFGEYLISKGADDSITNADGLTCYEGLNEANLGQL